MKSQEKNILRREKEQEAGKSLFFSRNPQMCIWGSAAWRAKQRVQEMRGERKAGARFDQLLQAKVKNSNVILGTVGNPQSSKQRRDTFYLNFLEDGLAALNGDTRGTSMEAGSHVQEPRTGSDERCGCPGLWWWLKWQQKEIHALVVSLGVQLRGFVNGFNLTGRENQIIHLALSLTKLAGHVGI